MSSNQVSSSKRPCPDKKLAHFSGRDRTLHICLVEDRTERREKLEEDVREALGGRGDLGLKPEDVVEEVRRFLDGLKEAVNRSIETLFSGELRDISLPKVAGDEVNPGEFVGDFLIYSGCGSRVVLHVEPKTGWGGYSKMLRDTTQFLDVLVSQTGVLESLLGNLYYPLLSSPVSYSILLLRLTGLILTSSPPRRTTTVRVISEDVVGRPTIPDTLKYMLQGYPLGMFERVRVEPHDYPFMLLARFHYDLFSRLPDLPVGNLHEATLGITHLRKLHLLYLTTPPLSSYLDALLKEEVSVQELLEETRKVARVNPYFSDLADLYEMYINDIGLIQEYVEKGVVAPLASSKIYELWVLTRIIDFLVERYRASIGIRKYRDLYIEFDIRFGSGRLSLAYNEPQQWALLEELTGKEAHLRPDYIVEGGYGTIVYDAKYKERIYPEDLKTMLAYIAEYARPLTVNHEKILLGVFYKLAENPETDKPCTAVTNSEIPAKVEVRAYPLDPRMSNDKIKDSIERSLKPLLTP